MPTFPVDLVTYLDCFPLEQTAFDLGEGVKSQPRTAGGEVIRSGGAARLWGGSFAMTSMRHDDARKFHGRLHVLRGSGASFFVRDMTHRGPTITATLAGVQANGTINISGGPANAPLSGSDYIGFAYGGRYALHQIVDSPNGWTLNSSGVRNGIEVIPPVLPGWTAGTPVTIGAATCLAVMVTSRAAVGASNRVATAGSRLEWTQTLRPVA